MNKHIASGNLTPVGTDWLIKMPTVDSWAGQIEVGFWKFLGLGLGERRERERERNLPCWENVEK